MALYAQFCMHSSLELLDLSENNTMFDILTNFVGD